MMRVLASEQESARVVLADGPSTYTIDPLRFPAFVQRAVFAECVADCRSRGLTRCAVFPAGRHSERIGIGAFEGSGVELVAYIDEERTGSLHGVRVVRPDEAIDGIDVVIVSSDAAERALERVARGWCEGRGVEVVRVYGTFDDPRAVVVEERRVRELERLGRVFNGRLNFGCGPHPLEGWTNIDGGDGEWYAAPELDGVVVLDVFDALEAIGDGSCEYVYSEHFYEHFTLGDGFRMAQEWHRVLRPGGIVRIVMPDLEMSAKIYQRDCEHIEQETFDRHRARWLGDRHKEEAGRFFTEAMYMNFGMRLDGHKFIYDEETARAQLEAAGFKDVVRCSFGESTHDALHGIDRHDGGETGGPWIKKIQLVVEATR